MAHKKNLTDPQEAVIACLLESETIKQAAIKAGVSTSTIYRWLKSEKFIIRLRAFEGVVLDAASRRLILLADKAITALEDIIDFPSQAGASQKRYAASTILDQVIKLWELRNIEQRISALEKG